MTAKEADKKLKELSLTAKYIGDGTAVTAQIPQKGTSVPGGSEILLYLGDAAAEQTVEVPDFARMHRQQASAAAGALGLYILPTGNLEISPSVTVTAQSIAPKTQVPVGTTIQLEFKDTKAPV